MNSGKNLALKPTRYMYASIDRRLLDGIAHMRIVPESHVLAHMVEL